MVGIKFMSFNILNIMRLILRLIEVHQTYFNYILITLLKDCLTAPKAGGGGVSKYMKRARWLYIFEILNIL